MACEDFPCCGHEAGCCPDEHDLHLWQEAAVGQQVINMQQVYVVSE